MKIPFELNVSHSDLCQNLQIQGKLSLGRTTLGSFLDPALCEAAYCLLLLLPSC